MLARLIRALRAIFGVAGIAASPIKAITGIVVGIITPYLLWTFLGGFGLALALVGLIWGVWYLATKKDRA